METKNFKLNRLFVIFLLLISVSTYGQKYYRDFNFNDMTGVGEISEKEYLKYRHKKRKFVEKGSHVFFSAFKVMFDTSNIVSKVVYSYYVINRISANRYEVSDSIIDPFFYQKAIFSLETEYIKSEVYSYSPMVNSVNFYTYEGQLLKREYRFRDKLLYVDSINTVIYDGTFNHNMLENCNLFSSCSKDKWVYETQETFDVGNLQNERRPIGNITRKYRINQIYRYDFLFTSLLGFKHPVGIYDSYIHCDVGLRSLFTTYYDIEGVMMLKEVKHFEVKKGNKRRRLKYIKPFHRQPKM